MNNLKQKLLSLGIFIDNEYLDSYCFLMEKNKNTIKTKGVTERHHIIQRAYYKDKNLPIDNSKDNLINISHFEHCLAHYYLCLCTNNKFSYINEYAFIKMVKIQSRFEFNLESFLNNAPLYNQIYKDFIEHQSELSKGHIPSIKGKHKYTDGIKVIISDTCPEGFQPYHPPKWHLSEETRKNISEAAKKRYSDPEARKRMSMATKGRAGAATNKVWITDGNLEKYIDLEKEPMPDGWRRGRSDSCALKNKHAKTTNGMKLISDGINQKYIDLSKEELPDGWYIGGSEKYKEQCRKAYAIGREKYKEKKLKDEIQKTNKENV